MKCKDAEALIMKYLDEEITEAEARELNAHLQSCEACAEDFKLYESLCSDMSLMPQARAPEGFENAVMSRIADLKPEYGVGEKIVACVWGLFAILFGSGSVLVYYSQAIINSLADNKYFSGVIESFAPIFAQLVQRGEELSFILGRFLGVTVTSLTGLASLVFGFFALFCSVRAFFAIKLKPSELRKYGRY